MRVIDIGLVLALIKTMIRVPICNTKIHCAYEEGEGKEESIIMEFFDIISVR